MKTDSKNAKPQRAADSTGDARLPHDRDEKAQAAPENAQHDDNRRPMRQAHDDVESGITDTERIGTPNDVPGSSANR